MKELTPSAKKLITSDWNAVFPSLGVYGPLHLLRRVGPLLVGIVLERDSSNRSYRPAFHVHNLAVESDSLSLILWSPLRTAKGAAETIDVKDHANRFKDAAQRLSNQALLPFAGDFRIEQVIEAYRRFQAPGDVFGKDPALFKDMALIYAWAGQIDKAQAIVNEGKSTMERWNLPRNVLDRMGGLVAWVAKVSAAIADPDKLRQTVEQQLASLHAQDLPVAQLLA